MIHDFCSWPGLDASKLTENVSRPASAKPACRQNRHRFAPFLVEPKHLEHGIMSSFPQRTKRSPIARRPHED
jgi:hypothetical protein